MTVPMRTALIGILLAANLAAQTLATLARSYRESPTAARQQALAKFAAGHSGDSQGALALLTLGVTAVEAGRFEEALGQLKRIESRLPELDDYVAYYQGQALAGLKRHEEAAASLSKVGGRQPASPLAGNAALAAARAWLAAGRPTDARLSLESHYSGLPQPAGDLTLAAALEAEGSLVQAAYYAQRVYFGYPLSSEAADAQKQLARLREQLGPDYPPPLASDMLARADKLFEAREYRRALREYEALAEEVGGMDRELALVRAGAARLQSSSPEAALRYLTALKVVSPEADAERLYYLVQCARRLEQADQMLDFIAELERLYPSSEWRLNALVWGGNYYLLRNEPSGYLPLFRACYQGFLGSARAEYCHWKVAWNAYLERRSEAAALLEEHLRLFPQAEKSAAALYFLGRMAEDRGDKAEAERFYRQIPERSPNGYYAALAESKLSKPLAVKPALLSFEPAPADAVRIRRSRLLAQAALFSLAEGELRFAARNDGTPHVLALELARQAGERGAPDVGIRHIKGVFPNYLSVPLPAAPQQFWRLAFPLPYRSTLERYAKLRRIDLHLLAGLIRQESEFTARAVSAAGARGLMQVLPSTGREIGKRLKLRPVSAASLFNPERNVQLGTFLLRSLLDTYEGSLEAALAAYNGGKDRVDAWRSWAEYREPAEFIENIPITETRNYVQAVLRNAWLYRRIYNMK